MSENFTEKAVLLRLIPRERASWLPSLPLTRAQEKEQLFSNMFFSKPKNEALDARMLSLSLEDCSKGKRIAVLGGSFGTI